ncbi:MAG TPA: hypothetical protein VFR37_21885 [Longimicrobium sp.]|nr:hypothetical protein [Longimicrobium sp.]
MSYERDYGNRNLLERAAHRVRGWIGHRGGRDMGYDDGYRGGMMHRGWNDERGYREMGGMGRGGYAGGMDRGYGAGTWRGYNDDWNRGMGGGRGGEYRTGGYNARHGGWDVDWDDSRPGGYGMERGGMDRGGMGRGWTGGGERDHYMGRDFMTNQGHYGHDRGWRDDDATLPGGDWNRGGMGGGTTGRGMMGGTGRGMIGGTDRDWNRGDRGDWDRGDWDRGGRNRGMQGGMSRGYAGGGMMDPDTDMGDADGGTIGNYGAYGGYGFDRFRSASAGGVPTGQYFRGYGVGSGYRG